MIHFWRMIWEVYCSHLEQTFSFLRESQWEKQDVSPSAGFHHVCIQCFRKAVSTVLLAKGCAQHQRRLSVF